jgi:Aspartyl/Asparaginyl beta-hydroxylase
MSSVGEMDQRMKASAATPGTMVPEKMFRAWRTLRRAVGQIVPPIVVAYFLPKIFAAYVVCGILDVRRNRPINADTLRRYCFGNGLLTWLLSPFNLLMDVLTIPYRNKGIYELDDLPPAYRDEIRAVIASAENHRLSTVLESRMQSYGRGMIFFKWYGRNMPASIDVPEFHAPYKYIRTIGVSVFNKRQSTSTHFGPLRTTLRVLYNINPICELGAYIMVGDRVHRWCENRTFIFDDTLQHKSCNETDRVRYCLFVDILRPSLFSILIGAIVAILGTILLPFRGEFYKHWKLVK